MFQRKLNQVITTDIRDAVPDRSWAWGPISQPIQAKVDIEIIPSIECCAWDTQHVEGLLDWQM